MCLPSTAHRFIFVLLPKSNENFETSNANSKYIVLRNKKKIRFHPQPFIVEFWFRLTLKALTRHISPACDRLWALPYIHERVMVSQHIPGWTVTHRNPPVYASWVLRLTQPQWGWKAGSEVKALATLAENTDSNPSTHTEAHNCL